jgi:multiple sugar transport system permease protein
VLSGRSKYVGILFVAPLLIAVGLLTIYPAISVIIMSLQDVQLANVANGRFVGLENYRRLLTTSEPSLGNVMLTTLKFVGGSVVFHIAIGLGLALLLEGPWVRRGEAFRTIYLLSWVTAGVIIGYTWKFLFEPRVGILNHVLALAGLPTQSWTADPQLSLPAITIANIWRGVPFALILQTAGLKSIDREVYDAAVVDGANRVQTFGRITVPLIREFLLLNVILDTGQTFHVFDTIFVMTGGGPVHRTETLSVFMYSQAFRYGDLGRGAAIGVVLLAISVVVAAFYMWIARPRASAVSPRAAKAGVLAGTQ